MEYIINELLQYDLIPITSLLQIDKDAQYVIFSKYECSQTLIRCYKYVNMTFLFDHNFYYKCPHKHNMIDIFVDIFVNFAKNYTANNIIINKISNKFLFMEKYTNGDVSFVICDGVKFMNLLINMRSFQLVEFQNFKKIFAYKYYFTLIWKIDDTSSYYMIG